MSEEIKVLSVNISEEKGTIKHPVDFIELDELGVKMTPMQATGIAR